MFYFNPIFNIILLSSKDAFEVPAAELIVFCKKRKTCMHERTCYKKGLFPSGFCSTQKAVKFWGINHWGGYDGI